MRNIKSKFELLITAEEKRIKEIEKEEQAILKKQENKESKENKEIIDTSNITSISNNNNNNINCKKDKNKLYNNVISNVISIDNDINFYKGHLNKERFLLEERKNNKAIGVNNEVTNLNNEIFDKYDVKIDLSNVKKKEKDYKLSIKIKDNGNKGNTEYQIGGNDLNYTFDFANKEDKVGLNKNKNKINENTKNENNNSNILNISAMNSTDNKHNNSNYTNSNNKKLYQKDNKLSDKQKILLAKFNNSNNFANTNTNNGNEIKIVGKNNPVSSTIKQNNNMDSNVFFKSNNQLNSYNKNTSLIYTNQNIYNSKVRVESKSIFRQDFDFDDKDNNEETNNQKNHELSNIKSSNAIIINTNDNKLIQANKELLDIKIKQTYSKYIKENHNEINNTRIITSIPQNRVESNYNNEAHKEYYEAKEKMGNIDKNEDNYNISKHGFLLENLVLKVNHATNVTNNHNIIHKSKNSNMRNSLNNDQSLLLENNNSDININNKDFLVEIPKTEDQMLSFDTLNNSSFQNNYLETNSLNKKMNNSNNSNNSTYSNIKLNNNNNIGNTSININKTLNESINLNNNNNVNIKNNDEGENNITEEIQKSTLIERLNKKNLKSIKAVGRMYSEIINNKEFMDYTNILKNKHISKIGEQNIMVLEEVKKQDIKPIQVQQEDLLYQYKCQKLKEILNTTVISKIEIDNFDIIVNQYNNIGGAFSNIEEVDINSHISKRTSVSKSINNTINTSFKSIKSINTKVDDANNMNNIDKMNNIKKNITINNEVSYNDEVFNNDVDESVIDNSENIIYHNYLENQDKDNVFTLNDSIKEDWN